MNATLWVLQGLLAVHTLMGALWKFSKGPAETMPSLATLSPTAWMGLSGLEILCAIGLLLPAIYRPSGILVPVAAALIVVEMLLFCVLHVGAGAADYGPMIYWLGVAALSSFVAHGRFVLSPLTPKNRARVQSS